MGSVVCLMHAGWMRSDIPKLRVVSWLICMRGHARNTAPVTHSKCTYQCLKGTKSCCSGGQAHPPNPSILTIHTPVSKYSGFKSRNMLSIALKSFGSKLYHFTSIKWKHLAYFRTWEVPRVHIFFKKFRLSKRSLADIRTGCSVQGVTHFNKVAYLSLLHPPAMLSFYMKVNFGLW